MNKAFLLLLFLGLTLAEPLAETIPEIITTENQDPLEDHQPTEQSEERFLSIDPEPKIQLEAKLEDNPPQFEIKTDTGAIESQTTIDQLEQETPGQERNLSDEEAAKSRSLADPPSTVKLSEHSIYDPSKVNVTPVGYEKTSKSGGSVNYLHVAIDNQSGGSKTNIVTGYLKKYLKVTSKESLSVEQMKVADKIVQNRFKVLRINRSTQQSRDYVVDVDFSDGNNDKSIYTNAKMVSMTSNGSDKFYLNDYEYTLQKDCEVIRSELRDPISIECIPFVNNMNYVVPQVYTVKYSFMKGGKEIKKRSMVVVSYSNVSKSMEPPTPRPSGKIPNVKSIIDLIQARIKSIPYFKNKVKVLNEIKKPVFAGKVKDYEKQILDFQKKNRIRLQKAQKIYQDNLRVALGKVGVSRRNDAQDFEATYEIMLQKTDEINAFNIRTAIKRAISDLENEQVYQVYRAKVRHFKRETALTDLLDRMDYMRYLADKHLDDNFEHYHTAEYFKK